MMEDDKYKILKDFIETNIRQRGIGNPNPIKLGRCIKELERIYGIREGSAGISHTNYFNGNSDPKTEKELADKLGVTQQTIQNYKKLTELVPELQDWVENR